MLLCQVVCVLSSSMRVSGDPHITTCVFGFFREVGCVTAFIALTEVIKAARSTSKILIVRSKNPRDP